MQEVISPALAAFVRQAPVARRAILAFVSSFARSLPNGAHVLDAGAGMAPYRELFSHCRYETQDWPSSEHANHHDHLGDLQEGLSLQPSIFDAVVCTEVLEHMRDAQAGLSELHRLLRAGGRLAVTVPFVGPLHEEPFDFRRMTNHGLKAVLEDSGFEDIVTTPLTGWFGTFAQILQEHAQSTRVEGRPPRLSQRVTGRTMLACSRVIGRHSALLDSKLDQRRALPIGWAAVATA